MSVRRRGVRGQHRSPRRHFSASKEEWERWDAAAAKQWPYTFAEWARRVLNERAELELESSTGMEVNGVTKIKATQDALDAAIAALRAELGAGVRAEPRGVQRSRGSIKRTRG